MEPSFPLTNLKTQLCVMAVGVGWDLSREAIWPEGAESFLRRLHRLGTHITIIGPRPAFKLGTKKTVRFLDRHEVVGMKMLAKSRSYRIEFRVLGRRQHAWTRLRAEAALAFGPYGVLPINFEGWNSPGTLTLDALSRWITEHRMLPGRNFVFLGSTNQALRWASRLLDLGAQSCHVIEPGDAPKCWRSYADRFVAKGGKLLVRNVLRRLQQQPPNAVNLYLDNDQGTRVLSADAVVLVPGSEDALNAPEQWKSGLFYIHRRSLPGETGIDEERWLEQGDWGEAYWRVAKYLKLCEHAEAEGALKKLKLERRKIFQYRRQGALPEHTYSGKILDRETLSRVQSAPSVPRNFARLKPVASLECFEPVACRICADVCPESAIVLDDVMELPKLIESKCTGCGACVSACPSGAAVMIRELPVQQKAHYYLADDLQDSLSLKPGTNVQLLNRRGEILGAGKALATVAHKDGVHRVLEVEASNVFLWDARNVRLPRTGIGEVENPHLLRPQEFHRVWVTINGVKRLCPADLPVSVALWQLGQRRFEDALYCRDGSCRRCEIKVDGKPALACKTIVREGQSLEYPQRPAEAVSGRTAAANAIVPDAEAGGAPGGRTLCACNNVSLKAQEALKAEGASTALVRELTGLGSGTCHGRWCLSGEAGRAQSGQGPLRPVFFGYEGSPWREITADDVLTPVSSSSASSADADVDLTTDLADLPDED